MKIHLVVRIDDISIIFKRLWLMIYRFSLTKNFRFAIVTFLFCLQICTHICVKKDDIFISFFFYCLKTVIQNRDTAVRYGTYITVFSFILNFVQCITTILRQCRRTLHKLSQGLTPQSIGRVSFSLYTYAKLSQRSTQ